MSREHSLRNLATTDPVQRWTDHPLAHDVYLNSSIARLQLDELRTTAATYRLVAESRRDHRPARVWVRLRGAVASGLRAVADRLAPEVDGSLGVQRSVIARPRPHRMAH